MNIDIERLHRDQLESRLRHIWDELYVPGAFLHDAAREFLIHASVEIALYNRQEIQMLIAKIHPLLKNESFQEGGWEK